MELCCYNVFRHAWNREIEKPTTWSHNSEVFPAKRQTFFALNNHAMWASLLTPGIFLATGLVFIIQFHHLRCQLVGQVWALISGNRNPINVSPGPLPRSVKKPARTKLPKVSRTPTSCEWWRRARSVIQKHHIEQLEFYPWKLDVICKGTLTFCIYSGKCKWHSLRQWSKSSVRRSAFQIRGVLKYCSIEGTHATRIYPQVSNRNQALQIKSKLRK